MSTTLGAWIEIKAVDAFSSSTRPTYPYPTMEIISCAWQVLKLINLGNRTFSLNSFSLLTRHVPRFQVDVKSWDDILNIFLKIFLT